MAKKSIGSSARGSRVKKNVKFIPDSQIDFSDIPEINGEQIKNGFHPGRPLLGTSPRTMIAIRIDPIVLKKIKKQAKRDGKGYQTLINEILGKFVKKEAA